MEITPPYLTTDETCVLLSRETCKPKDMVSIKVDMKEPEMIRYCWKGYSWSRSRLNRWWCLCRRPWNCHYFRFRRCNPGLKLGFLKLQLIENRLLRNVMFRSSLCVSGRRIILPLTVGGCTLCASRGRRCPHLPSRIARSHPDGCL